MLVVFRNLSHREAEEWDVGPLGVVHFLAAVDQLDDFSAPDRHRKAKKISMKNTPKRQ